MSFYGPTYRLTMCNRRILHCKLFVAISIFMKFKIAFSLKSISLLQEKWFSAIAHPK